MSERLPAPGPAPAEPPDAWAGARVPLRAALLAVALAFAFTAAARGLPGLDALLVDARGRRALQGAGGLVDAALPGGGKVDFERVRLVEGREVRVIQSTTAGPVVASTLLQLALLGLVLAGLRRVAPAVRLLPDRRDVERAASVLAAAAPVVVVAGVGAGLVAGAVDGGRPLERAVWRLALPLLAHPVWGALLVVKFVVVAPLAEEAVWRGVVYPGLRGRLPARAAGVLAALLFGAWHVASGWAAEPAALTLQYCFGLLACALVERRPGALGTVVLVHAAGNAAALALFAVAMTSARGLVAAFGG